MSLFLHPTNQELLWQSIHKISLFPAFVTTIPSKEQWFKEQIRTIYERGNLVSISKDQLSAVNRMTIQFMAENIKSHLSTIYSPPIQNPPPTPSPQSDYTFAPVGGYTPSSPSEYQNTMTANKEITREWISGQKKEALNAVFQERQKSYDSLLKTPAPTPITFTDATSDAPITNMEELIKQHMAERELLEIPSPPSQTVSQKPNTITISNEPPIHNLQVMDVPSEAPSKKVRFVEDEPNTAILTAISTLTQKIDEFRKTLETVSADVEHMKIHIFGPTSNTSDSESNQETLGEFESPTPRQNL